MAVERPTFSESWYRVTDLKPRLRSTVQTYRQHYRGQMWHVVRDPSNNNFFRLNDAAYYFVGMLDGHRTVEQVWDACNSQLGDMAPTQGEAIQLLGQLYTSNLLSAELAADAAGMFERYRKRVRREITGYMQNILFPRIPLVDPDAFLNRWVGLFGLLFTPVAFVCWLILLGFGVNAISGKFGVLLDMASPENILDPENLIWMGAIFWGIKICHELGHAFSCKKFGQDTGSSGEVHTIGIMFLVFMPFPYVDASSSWALRSKLQRAIVGMAGMYVELAIAAVAAIVWANTAETSAIHPICFRIILLASVSTVLFNGNPLLRFDAYYILSDLLEIPNLSQRAKDYLYYLVKRYAYGIERARSPIHVPGERKWMVLYGITASIYRVFISVGIMLYIMDKAKFIGVILAAVSVFTWVIKPCGKWIHFLSSSPELLKTRQRAVVSTALFWFALFMLIGVIPVQEHDRAQGVIEPRHIRHMVMLESGFIDSVTQSDRQVQPGDAPLLTAYNDDLTRDRVAIHAQLTQQILQLDRARSLGNNAEEQYQVQEVARLKNDLAQLDARLEALRVTPSMAGLWVSWQLEQAVGAYLQRGEPVGTIIEPGGFMIRAVADQELGPRLVAATQAGQQVTVEFRPQGRPADRYFGVLEKVYAAGSSQLPSASLGFRGGGSMQTRMDDKTGRQASENFFEARIGSLRTNASFASDQNKPNGADTMPVYTGQRVVVRFNLGAKPLVVQWWRQIAQMLQRRYGST